MNDTTVNQSTNPGDLVDETPDPADVHNPGPFTRDGAAMDPAVIATAATDALMPGALRSLLSNPAAIAGPAELLAAATAAAAAWRSFLSDLERLAASGRNVEALRAIPEALPEMARLVAAVDRMGL